MKIIKKTAQVGFSTTIMNISYGKIYLIYDESARIRDLDNCTVLNIVKTKEEAVLESKKYNGVVVEAICDNDNNIIKKTIFFNL